jgi:hypothetical protein
MWLPTAALPRFGVQWTAARDDDIACRHRLDDVEVQVRYRLDADARIVSVCFDRWGDPAGTGQYGFHPFGGDVTRYGSFGGISIPVAGRMGWGYGTDGWPKGEFFRYRITALDPA